METIDITNHATSVQGALDPKFKKSPHTVQPLNLSTILYGRASLPACKWRNLRLRVVKQAAKVIGSKWQNLG